MSKSIYEEALQEIKDVTADLRDLEIIHSYDVGKIKQALEKAQKQEKLLNQIKEVVDRPHTYIAAMLESSNRFYEIKELIRELEK